MNSHIRDRRERRAYYISVHVYRDPKRAAFCVIFQISTFTPRWFARVLERIGELLTKVTGAVPLVVAGSSGSPLPAPMLGTTRVARIAATWRPSEPKRQRQHLANRLTCHGSRLDPRSSHSATQNV